ncbi:hypothetical protein BOTCAL_1275g00010 [Botryotinia calthae]|uniref:DNA 3'-5' helicase n=1 Tax=Botryotinia calthae TaxID=38488 RepID=A0A4Y8CFD6_9HELO|nr:hypothetical protein BOTCAL_1275g00010 [Botryotinia calthae]
MPPKRRTAYGRKADGRSKRAKARKLKDDREIASAVPSTPTVSTVGLDECMKRIHEVELKNMPAMIKEGGTEKFIEKQEELIGLCLERILWFLDPTAIRKPKPMQTRILRRLIYGKSDTLCIAKTGFGKSPEQAASSKFRDALASPELQSNIGLVAIDECHLISQWKEFRPKFTMLGQLRHLLPQEVMWFGCTATLDAESQKVVLDDGGFRRLGSRPYQTHIIRTSVDRPNISLAIVPIPYKQTKSLEPLYYLLDDAIDEDGNPTPEKIPKTIIFVNSRNETDIVKNYLRNALLEKTKGKTVSYSIETENKSLSVMDIIISFHSKVGVKDRAMRYDEFAKVTSIARITVATTTLATGINIYGIDLIVLWDVRKQLITEIWQRIGRGGRGPGCVSIAHIFIPYYCFDSNGSYPTVPEGSNTNTNKTPISTRKITERHLLPSHRKAIRFQASQALESQTENEDSVDEEETDVETNVENGIASSNIVDSTSKGQHVWTKIEITQRASVLPVWLTICNSLCYRKAFLDRLGENLLPIGEEREIVLPERCCSKCNPDLLPIPSKPLNEVISVSKPRKGTLSAFALEVLEKWCKIEAPKVATSRRRFALPSSYFMEETVCWEVADLYRRQPHVELSDWWDELTLDQLCEKVPNLKAWRYFDKYKDELVSLFQGFHPEIECLYTAYRQMLIEAKKAREEVKQRKDASKKTSGAVVLASAREQLNATRIASDNTLARQVLQQNQLRRGNGPNAQPRVQMTRSGSPLVLNKCTNTPHIESNQLETPTIQPEVIAPSTPIRNTTLIRSTMPIKSTPRRRRVPTPPPLVFEDRIATSGLFSPIGRFGSLVSMSSPSNRFGSTLPILPSPSLIGSPGSVSRDTDDFLARLRQRHGSPTHQVEETQPNEVIPETQLDNEVIPETQYHNDDSNDDEFIELLSTPVNSFHTQNVEYNEEAIVVIAAQLARGQMRSEFIRPSHPQYVSRIVNDVATATRNPPSTQPLSSGRAPSIVSSRQDSIAPPSINGSLFHTPTASRAATPALSNASYEYFNNGFGDGSEGSEESDVGGGGNDDSNIGNAGAASGVTTQHTLGATNTGDNAAAACIPEEAEVKHISKEAFEEMQKGCAVRRPWPWSNVKSKGLYPPTQQHKWWYVSGSDWDKATPDKQRDFSHIARIMELEIGEQLPEEERCAFCRGRGFECWVYSSQGLQQVTRPGSTCARCRWVAHRGGCSLSTRVQHKKNAATSLMRTQSVAAVGRSS